MHSVVGSIYSHWLIRIQWWVYTVYTFNTHSGIRGSFFSVLCGRFCKVFWNLNLCETVWSRFYSRFLWKVLWTGSSPHGKPPVKFLL